MKLSILVPLVFALSFSARAQEAAALPNPSFEKTFEGRPKGWRFFSTPSGVAGEFYVDSAQEGVDSHGGSCALQFKFPSETEISQCVWMADPVHAGMPAGPGRFGASFWIKAEGLVDGFHAWVTITGFDSDNKRLEEIARSDYLQAKDLPEGEWSRVSFSFEIPEGSAVARIAPSVVFKTRPDSSPNTVPPSTRILVDDLEIEKR